MTACSPIDFTSTSPRAPRTAAGRADLHFAPRRAVEILRAIADQSGGPGWDVRKLTNGGQAHLFVASAAGGAAPLNGKAADEELIVKVYRDQSAAAREAARDEFHCLRRLHGRLDGTQQHGWKIRCPLPLHFSDWPAALVMTRVPGRPLSWHLARGKGPSLEVLQSISRAIDASLLLYWAGEPRQYGDLILNNVLLDVPARTLSLVDPGLPERFYLCDGAPSSWYPASRDLAFLLFWTASLVRPSILHPILHARQKRMAVRIVRTFLDGLKSEAERDEATAEIEACARLHLARITASASVRGLWRLVVKCAAARTIDRFVQELRGMPPVPAGGVVGC
jgi:hypothetical protein